jgi:hypothetical protein
VPHAAVAIVEHRLADLAFRVHHERAVADDRLLDRRAAEEERRRVLVGVDDDARARAVEEPDLRAADGSEPFTRSAPRSTTSAVVCPSGTAISACAPARQAESPTSIGVNVFAGPVRPRASPRSRAASAARRARPTGCRAASIA